MRIALFPGSFDPVTKGHEEIIHRGMRMFDKVIVAIGINSHKSYLFTVEERMEMLRRSFAAFDSVEVASYTGLTVDFARENGANFLLRGIRSNVDLSYEQPTSLINRHLNDDIDTVYLHSYPETSHISSTIVREVIRYQGKLEGLVPEEIVAYIHSRKYKD